MIDKFMAFVPDKAIDDFEEVGKPAFLLFVFYCKHGSIKKNKVSVALEAAALWHGIHYDHAARLNKILKKKTWIKITKKEIFLLKGFENLLDSKTDKNISLEEKETDENVSLENENTDKNVSFSNQETDKNISFNEEVEKTDENISLLDKKLTKTSVSRNSKTDENISLPPTPPNKDINFKLNQLESREQLSTAPAESTRIPKDFELTQDMRNWAQKNLPEIVSEIETATELWKDYYLALPGDRALSADWEASWRRGMKQHVKHKNEKGAKLYETKNGSNQQSGAGGKSIDQSNGKKQGNNSDSNRKPEKLKYQSKI